MSVMMGLPRKQRREEIALLALRLLSAARWPDASGAPIGFTAGAMRRLREYHWPDGTRELKSVIDAAVAIADGPMLDELTVAFAIETGNRPAQQSIPNRDVRPRPTDDMMEGRQPPGS